MIHYKNTENKRQVFPSQNGEQDVTIRRKEQRYNKQYHVLNLVDIQKLVFSHLAYNIHATNHQK